MKKSSCRLVPYLKMLKRRVINLIKGIPDFFSKAIKVVHYPQYSLFGIELIFFLGLILYSIILALPIFNLEVIMSIFNLGVITSRFNFEVIVLKFSLDVMNSTSNLELITSILNLEVIKLILNIFNLYFLIKHTKISSEKISDGRKYSLLFSLC